MEKKITIIGLMYFCSVKPNTAECITNTLTAIITEDVNLTGLNLLSFAII